MYKRNDGIHLQVNEAGAVFYEKFNVSTTAAATLVWFQIKESGL